MVIRVAITDDHELVREGLVQCLRSSPGIEVAAEAANGEELLGKLRTTQVDLLLLDMSMPGEDGADLIRHIKSIYPDLLILVLSMHDDVSTIRHAIKAGATGYLSKVSSRQAMLDAIWKIIETGKYLSPQMAEQLAYASISPDLDDIDIILSERELEIYRLIMKGKSVSEIAKQLFISDKTVSTHKCNLLDKLGLNNIVDLVHYSEKHGLFR